jgi:Ca-activated chloride channel family protein
MNRLPQIESILGRIVLKGENASPLPLKKTIILGQVTGPLLSVLVTQHFSNPFSFPLELDYLFPLPSKAAIVDFELRIGSRHIQADIQELEQARQAYEEASRSSQRAGLLEQRRPNLFAIHLTNVLPGEAIEASIRFQDRLKFEDGAFEVVFPMGLTPRYNTRDHPEESAQTNSPIAQVGDEIGKVEISLAIDAGARVSDPTSPTHPLRVTRLDDRRMQVSIEGDHIPDHDFVLRYALQGENVQVYAWTSRDRDGDYMLASLFPPAIPEDYVPPQREFVFVLDRSGSMTGEPIAQARNALRACLRSLNVDDTFRILLFDDKLEWYNQKAANITQGEITHADQYIDKVEGRGGTEILLALQAIFDLAVDPTRARYLVFLTDGAVSAEERALDQIRTRLGTSRLFTFGIGPSVNRALLEQLASLGRGTSEFLQLDEDIEGAIIRFQDRVSFPVLTDLSLAWKGAKGWDIYPRQLPDLFAGQPIEICGRFASSAPDSRLIVYGKRAGQEVEVNLALQPAVGKEDAIQRVWNRARVDTLLNQLQNDPSGSSALRQKIIALALQARLVTPFTAFVAIDQDISVKDPGQRQTIHVAQPLPKNLERSGFVAPPAPMAFQAAAPKRMIIDVGSLDMPAFLRRSGAKMPGGPLPSPQPPVPAGKLHDGGAQFDAHQDYGSLNEPMEEILRWLARTQLVNGSWHDDVEQTSAGLLAFIRHGHTTRSGNFRQIVKRAFSWLENQSVNGQDMFIKTLALAELAAATQQAAHHQAAASAFAALPPPATLLEKAVIACIEVKAPPSIAAKTEVNNINDLRLYSALKLTVKVATALLEGKEADLARIWSAVLK